MKSNACPVNNNRGFFHLHLLSIGFFFLAMYGAWNIYNSYKQNKLSENMTMMMNDYKNLTMQAVTNTPDRQKVERNLQEIKQIISKSPAGHSSKPFYHLEYPYSK